MLRIHDTALARVVPLDLREPGHASIYVCGPTVYDLPHLGHGRHLLVYDVLRRYLEWSGVAVRFVSNVTDIDDNIIKRANEEGRSTDEVVAEYEAAWWDAADRLGVLRPTVAPHATEYVEQMVDLVRELLARDVAYETSDGVYLAVEKVEGYGLLAGQSTGSLRAGARVEVVEEKRSPIDFALWKKAKPGEPSWSSPWGEGRPGWHTECVVMSLDLLGERFDLHTGGLDLKFPHHENERAQAVALGRAFSRHWMHHGFVEVGGEKMSKSLGNFTTLSELLERVPDGRAYRLLVLQSHYRSPVEVTPETIDRALTTVRGLDDFARRAQALPGAPQPDEATLDRFRERMDDDLDTPGAMSVLFGAVRAANAAIDAGDTVAADARRAAVDEMCTAVGLEARAGGDDVDAETADLVARRDAARAAKDWSTADSLRDALVAKGWVVEDTAGGTRVHRNQ